MNNPEERLRHALNAEDASERLEAAMAAGTRPNTSFVNELVERCAVEPDFYVREMLTWGLTQQDRHLTLERVMRELDSEIPQARSQALHTLSKLREPSAWSEITREMLTDDDDEVAKAAWRAAVTLVTDEEKAGLAQLLATQFGRGGQDGREVQLSLSRAFQTLGPTVSNVVSDAQHAESFIVRVHALATERIMNDPDEGFEAAMFEARLVSGESDG